MAENTEATGNITVGGTSNYVTGPAAQPVEPAPLPTQAAHPWRASVRTVVEALIGFALMAPTLYEAIMQQDPGQATGAAAVALGIAAAITRVAALPQVDALLTRWGMGAKPREADLVFSPREVDAGVVYVWDDEPVQDDAPEEQDDAEEQPER